MYQEFIYPGLILLGLKLNRREGRKFSAARAKTQQQQQISNIKATHTPI